MDRAGIAHDFVTVKGGAVNHKVGDRSTQVVTELNESGHMTDADALVELLTSDGTLPR